jgi:hypothetical protein
MRLRHDLSRIPCKVLIQSVCCDAVLARNQRETGRAGRRKIESICLFALLKTDGMTSLKIINDPT